MALTSNQKVALRATYGDLISSRRDGLTLSKSQLDAAISAIDDWIEANATSFNQALPVAARTGLSASQKSELLYLVALRRFGG